MTIGQTSIKLSTVIDHSLRRIGLPAEAQTPEIVATAKSNLFFILNNFTNRGMTYWCIDQQYLTLVENQIVYDMPDGTIDILNANYRSMTISSGSDATSSTEMVRAFTEETDTVMIRLNSTYSGVITISYSNDDVTYTTHSTITHDGTNKWYIIEPTITAIYLKLSVTTSITIDELVTVSGYSDTSMYRMNRYEYSSLSNKHSVGTPLQFWYNRQISPTMNVWPTANSAASENCIYLFRNHQIPDIGLLTEELSIPNRWLEAMIWGLAQNMAFEVPNTPPERISMMTTMAEKSLAEAQGEERDNSTVEFSPDISVYTS